MNSNDIEMLKSQASVYLKNKEYKKAEAAFTQALQINPTDIGLYGERASVRDKLRDYYGADEDRFSAKLCANPNDDKTYTHRAAHRRSHRHYAAAISDCTKALAINPNNVDAYNQSAQARELSEDYSGAIKDATNALRIDPDNAEALRRRAFLYLQTGDYKSAEADYSKLLSVCPNDERALEERARIREYTDNYSGAIDDYSKLLKKDQRTGSAYAERGFAYCMLNDRESAKKDFEQLLGYDPNAKDRYYASSGLAFALREDYQSALKEYDEALRIAQQVHPANTYLYLNRAYVRFMLNDYAGASNDYTSALKDDPDCEEAASGLSRLRRLAEQTSNQSQEHRMTTISNSTQWYYQLRADFFFRLCRYKQALENYDIALRIQPDDVYTYLERARCKRFLLDNKGAEEDYEKALHIKPDCADAYMARARHRHIRRDDKGALEDYSKAIAIDPKSGKAIKERSDIQLLQLMTNKGPAPNLDDLVQANPNDADAYLKRAFSRFQSGNYEGAIDDCNRAFKLSPLDLRSVMLRAAVLQKTGDAKAAAQLLKKFHLDDFNTSSF
jgi:tetratricopeptide (TPR) repeat protein